MDQFRRVTLVDDQGMFTELITAVLERRGYRCRVVDPGARSPDAVARAVTATRAEMAIANIDLGAAPGDGAAVVHALARSGHRLLAIVANDRRCRAGEALALGAHAVATTDLPVTEFLTAVRKTMRGAPVITRQERTRLISAHRALRAGRTDVVGRFASLSSQERAILGHLMAGRAVREIAARHVVSEHTVRTQVRAVLTKLEVSSQVEAVAVAWAHGWDGSGELRPTG